MKQKRDRTKYERPEIMDLGSIEEHTFIVPYEPPTKTTPG